MNGNLKILGLAMFPKILELIKVNIKVNLAYAVNAWGAFIVTLFQIFVFYYIWMAIYKFDTIINGITKDQIITYIILSRIIYTQITWGFIPKIGRIIQTGAISMELLRPMDFMLLMFFERIGDFLSFTAMTGIPILIICSLTLGMKPPPDFLTFIYFILSFLMAMMLSFFFEFFVGLLTFYTNYSWGLQTFQEAFVSLFSGALIPIAFFPGWLKIITNFLPFQQMSYSPVTIYLGIVKGHEIIEVLSFQLLWLVILFIFTRLCYTFAIKKVTVQGG